MRNFLLILTACFLASVSYAKDVNIGVLLGYTGPIESLTPDMASAAEAALKEASDSGKFLSGSKIVPIRADSTCVDASAATAAAERLISSDSIKAIMGADCSGVTTAVLQNVALPKGIVMISPSATTPSLSEIKDNGFFFRTAPSDARQGEVLSAIMKTRGITQAALTYTNNDYGKGLADSIKSNFEKGGGKITASVPHEDGKGDYTAEVGTLAQAGGHALIVVGYLDQGGKSIIQASLDSGAFDTFVLPDGMIGESLPTAIGSDLNGSFGTRPGGDNKGKDALAKIAKTFKADAPYAPESYDAAALIVLAMQKAGSADNFKDKVTEIANAPGTKIYPGELSKALKLISQGKEINYEGATDVNLIGSGETAGKFLEIEVTKGKNLTIDYH